MRTLRRRRLLLIALLCPAGAAFAQSPLSDAETRRMRAVIEAQLRAFAADDGELAFSYATRELRQQFGSAERFMAMVRGSYPVVYRPSAVRFLLPERIEQQVLQAVQMTDAEGKPWLALYQMQLQADQGWRIAGCRIVENRGRST
jgi:hypothetical protein